MEQLKNIKQCLMAQLQGQMSNLQNVDTKELGEVVDMIKDLEEAMYYCSIVKAMEESKEKEMYQMMNPQSQMYYTPIYYPEYPRDMDRGGGRMYYSGGSSSNSGGSNGNNSNGNNARGGGSRGYMEMYPEYMEMRDHKEGRSPMSRKTYMEGKQMHQSKETQMKELEKYLQELSQDVTEMIQDASPEEKQMLQQKISILATKIK